MPDLPPTVLLVDVPEPLGAQLQERGYRIDSGAPPEAVVLGGERALELLDDGRYGAAPVIVLAERADVPALLERGAHDCVGAPFDVAELDARLRAALRVRALHDQLVEANERLAAQAMTDELTGLANRRHGAHELAREIAFAVRHGQPLALVRVDVDRFKDVNDGYGHQAGDEVLAEVARRLADAVRAGDELARWGGDEFVAILPATDRDGALRAAERLRAAVADAPVRVGGGTIPVTVSVGWAHWVGDTPDDLLARADRALYAAKDAGRDTIHPPR